MSLEIHGCKSRSEILDFKLELMSENKQNSFISTHHTVLGGEF